MKRLLITGTGTLYILLLSLSACNLFGPVTVSTTHGNATIDSGRITLDSLVFRIPKPQTMAMRMAQVPTGDGFTLTLERTGETVNIVATANRDVPNVNTRLGLQNKTMVLSCNLFLRIPSNVVPRPAILAHDSAGYFIPSQAPEIRLKNGNFPGVVISDLWQSEGGSLFSGQSLKGFGVKDDGFMYLPLRGESDYSKNFYPAGAKYILVTVWVPESWPVEIVKESVTLESMYTEAKGYLGMPESVGGRPFPFNQIIVE